MHIESRWVCIATDEQVGLAASISSLLYKKGSYLPFLAFPKVKFAYSATRDVNEDGYFDRVLDERATYRINNTLARIQPKLILLLGLTSIEKGYLEVLLPTEKLRDVNSVSELSTILPGFVGPIDSIACRPTQVEEGLIEAYLAGKGLIISNEAHWLTVAGAKKGRSVIFIENTNSVNDIAALNYAAAVGADVILLPSVEPSELRGLPRDIYAWSRDRSHPAFRTLKRQVAKRLGEIDLANYEHATFFTSGIPYGFALENKIPIAHVAKDVDCGVFLLDSLVEENDPLVFDSALIFSPQSFESEETSEVGRILARDLYVVKQVLGREATVKNFANNVSLYPFDLLHICSHGGETDGYFAALEFNDRQGDKHVVEFYEVIGISPGKADMVRMSRKIIFKSFDGMTWGSEEIWKLPAYIFEDMRKELKTNSITKANRVRANYPIALSCHVRCIDSIHQGDFDSLAGFGHPVIFNNSCSSSHELVNNFIHAGARCYIGTLWSVGNETAQKAAKLFYETASQVGSLLEAFFKMSRGVANERYKNIYIFWGLPTTTYRKPSHKSSLRVQGAIANSYLSASKAEAACTDEFAKDHHREAKKFLWNELNKNAFRGKESDPFPNGTTPQQSESERDSLSSPEGFGRTSEIELEVEERYEHLPSPGEAAKLDD
jgi:hypothetical protein